MISPPKRAGLRVAKGKLRMHDETCRQILVRIARVTTCTDLDRDGFQSLMGFFEYLGFQPIDTSAPRPGR